MSLLLKNVRFAGFPCPLPESADVRVENGIVTELGPDLSPRETDTVFDGTGKRLSPGWIDIHTHVYYGATGLGVRAERIGPRTGVTVLADAGSAGEITFPGFREYIVERHAFPIYAFLNIGSTGIVWTGRISEFDGLDKMRLPEFLACAAVNRDVIKAVKVRASGVIFQGWGAEAVKMAKEAAREAELPLVVHVGEPLPMLGDILPLLDRGDIVTHIYHGKQFGILRRGGLIPELEKARGRGVLFDVGHGAASFSFDVAVRAFELGFLPDFVSTDLHVNSLAKGVFFSSVLTKMLALGLNENRVFGLAAKNAAALLGEETFETGLMGKRARFTVFSIEKTDEILEDAMGGRLRVDRRVAPCAAVVGETLTLIPQEEDARGKA